jgi:hypothetical protein
LPFGAPNGVQADRDRQLEVDQRRLAQPRLVADQLRVVLDLAEQPRPEHGDLMPGQMHGAVG